MSSSSENNKNDNTNNKIKIGDNAPDFELLDTNQESHNCQNIEMIKLF